MSGRTEVRAKPCGCCEATGRVIAWEQDEDGCEYLRCTPEPCRWCDGTGLMVAEVEPIEMEDLPEEAMS